MRRSSAGDARAGGEDESPSSQLGNRNGSISSNQFSSKLNIPLHARRNTPAEGWQTTQKGNIGAHQLEQRLDPYADSPQKQHATSVAPG